MNRSKSGRDAQRRQRVLSSMDGNNLHHHRRQSEFISSQESHDRSKEFSPQEQKRRRGPQKGLREKRRKQKQRMSSLSNVQRNKQQQRQDLEVWSVHDDDDEKFDADSESEKGSPTNSSMDKDHKNQAKNSSTQNLNDTEAEESLEIPYYQPLEFPGSSQIMLGPRGGGGRKSEEPLRAGDIIQYFNPIFVAHTKVASRITQVVAVQPNHKEFLLQLGNREWLPRDCKVKRIREYVPSTGNLYTHVGTMRPIEAFRLIPSQLPEANRTGMTRQIERIRAAFAKELNKTVERAYQQNKNESESDDDSDLDRAEHRISSSKAQQSKKNQVHGDGSDSESELQTTLAMKAQSTNLTRTDNHTDSDTDLEQFRPTPRKHDKNKKIVESLLDSDSEVDNDSMLDRRKLLPRKSVGAVSSTFKLTKCQQIKKRPAKFNKEVRQKADGKKISAFSSIDLTNTQESSHDEKCFNVPKSQLATEQKKQDSETAFPSGDVFDFEDDNVTNEVEEAVVYFDGPARKTPRKSPIRVRDLSTRKGSATKNNGTSFRSAQTLGKSSLMGRPDRYVESHSKKISLTSLHMTPTGRKPSMSDDCVYLDVNTDESSNDDDELPFKESKKMDEINLHTCDVPSAGSASSSSSETSDPEREHPTTTAVHVVSNAVKSSQRWKLKDTAQVAYAKRRKNLALSSKDDGLESSSSSAAEKASFPEEDSDIEHNVPKKDFSPKPHPRSYAKAPLDDSTSEDDELPSINFRKPFHNANVSLHPTSSHLKLVEKTVLGAHNGGQSKSVSLSKRNGVRGQIVNETGRTFLKLGHEALGRQQRRPPANFDRAARRQSRDTSSKCLDSAFMKCTRSSLSWTDDNINASDSDWGVAETVSNEKRQIAHSTQFRQKNFRFDESDNQSFVSETPMSQEEIALQQADREKRRESLTARYHTGLMRIEEDSDYSVGDDNSKSTRNADHNRPKKPSTLRTSSGGGRLSFEKVSRGCHV